MGLSITGVSYDYKINEEEGDFEGEEFSSTDIGYFGYKFFRDALIEFCTDGRLNLDSNYGGGPLAWCFYDDETYEILFEPEDFSEERLKNPKVQEYQRKLNSLKKDYPKLYEVYDFVCHCDAEGIVPAKTCKRLLPILKEFYQADKKNYGYSGWDYNFTENLISILEEVVQVGGKLYFS